jgi:hypothetical protein
LFFSAAAAAPRLSSFSLKAAMHSFAFAACNSQSQFYFLQSAFIAFLLNSETLLFFPIHPSPNLIRTALLLGRRSILPSRFFKFHITRNHLDVVNVFALHDGVFVSILFFGTELLEWMF